MSRQIRKVPANWEHPKMQNGNYQPMYNKYYIDALNEWLKNHYEWDNGTHKAFKEYNLTKEEYPFYAMWNGDAPEIDYYQTKKWSDDELTHIQLYETVTEGTPVSPVFPKEDFEKLCEWAATNATVFAALKATKEEWMRMLGNNCVSAQVDNIVFM